ncbi:hypothetical protein [Streptomyces sp. NPDC056817]|uniref:hypothetical protein n=1 Tax=Streptomyces sp. NPDC056817 TaxID=3345950 RepID=UPI0036A83B0C
MNVAADCGASLTQDIQGSITFVGEYVGVDPVRVRKLADRLGDLEEALSRYGALIRKNFKSWESDLDLSQLAQQVRAVGDDARDTFPSAPILPANQPRPSRPHPSSDQLRVRVERLSG